MSSIQEKINDGNTKYVAEKVAENLSTLTTLDMSNKQFGGDSIHCVLIALDSNTKLKTLNLSKNQIDDQSASVIAETIKRNDSIEKLYLKNNKMTQSGLSLIIDALEENYSIIDMTIDELDSKEVERMEEYLERNDHYSIDEKNKPKRKVYGPRDGTSTVVKKKKEVVPSSPIPSAVSTSSGLRELASDEELIIEERIEERNGKKVRVKTKKIVKKGEAPKKEPFKEVKEVKKEYYEGPFQIQIQRLYKNDVTLKTLLLSGKKIENFTAIEICRALESNTVCKTLDLKDNLIGDSFASAFKRMLGLNKTLEIVELDGNKFGSNAIDEMLSGLEKNYSLNDLLLDEHDMNDSQLDLLDDCIVRNKKNKSTPTTPVVVVTPSYKNSTTPKVVVTTPVIKKDSGFYEGPFAGQIVRVSTNDKSLKNLLLPGKKIEDFTAKEILKGLKGNTVIKKVDLRDNSMSDDLEDLFVEMIEKNTCLESLEISGNPFSTMFYGEIIDAMEKNHSLIDVLLDENVANTSQVSKMNGILDRNRNEANQKKIVVVEKVQRAPSLLDSKKSTSTPTKSSQFYDGPFQGQIGRLYKNDSTLKALNLSEKKVEDSTAIEIFKALENNQFCTKVDMTDNLLTEAIWESFDKMMCTNTSLLNLEMEGNKFSSDSIAKFISSLEKNTTMVDLTVSEYATDDQLDMLDDYLDRNYSIKKKREKEGLPSTPVSQGTNWKTQGRKQEMIVKEAVDSGSDLQENKQKFDFRSNLKPMEKKESFTKKQSFKVEKKVETEDTTNVFKSQIQKEKKERPRGGGTGEVHFLLRWVNNLIPTEVHVANFTEDWMDGKAFCALANIQDDGLEYDPSLTAEENIEEAFDTFTKMGIEPILDPHDAGKEKKTMMLYLKLIKDEFKNL